MYVIPWASISIVSLTLEGILLWGSRSIGSHLQSQRKFTSVSWRFLLFAGISSFYECRLRWLLGVWFHCNSFVSRRRMCWRWSSNGDINWAPKCSNCSLVMASTKLVDLCIVVGGHHCLKWPDLRWFTHMTPSVSVWRRWFGNQLARSLGLGAVDLTLSACWSMSRSL